RVAQALDVPLAVDAVAAGLALDAGREQPDLLVVADRARRGAHHLGDLADPQARMRGRARAHGAASAGSCAGRRSDTPAPASETAARTHSAVCMLWMNGAS